MLLTKTQIPPLQEQLVNRHELFTRLNTASKHKLTLISAPAGFGKTTLISTWIHQNDLTAVWFSISSEDNDPVTFFSYLINAFNNIKKDFGRAAIKLLQAGNTTSIKSAVNLIINELVTFNEDIFYVIDDFHLIENNEINEFLNHFLNFLPEHVHLVILTRCDPNIQVSRLRSQLQLLEIRANDLSFSQTETALLVKRNLKLSIDETAIEKLFSKTEGWIAGLQLAVLSLQNHNDPASFINDFSGSNLYIMEYLIDEVLNKQNNHIKNFLICTSILEILSAPLCNKILNITNSQKILKELESANMFLFPIDNTKKAFRYHHLFAELLQQKLSEFDNQFINSLHENAAVWYNNNNMPNLAIQHSLMANNHQNSVDIFGKNIADLWEAGQQNTILNICRDIPQQLLFSSRHICLYFSWVLLDSGNLNEAYTYLEQGEKNCKEHLPDPEKKTSDSQKNNILIGRIAVAMTRYFAHIPNIEKIKHYNKTASKYLSKGDSFWQGWSCFTEAIIYKTQDDIAGTMHCYHKGLAFARKSDNLYLVSLLTISLGYMEFRLGKLHSSYNRYQELLSYLNKKGYSQYAKEESSYALLYASMGIIEFYRVDLEKAAHNIDIAYKLVKKDTNITNKSIVLIAYSLINYLTGDKIRSWEKLEELEPILMNMEVLPDVLTLYLSWKGFLLVNQGELNEAELFFSDNQIVVNNNIPVSDIHRYTPLALWLIEELRLEEAESFLLSLNQQVEKLQRIEHLVEIKILLTYLYLQKSDKSSALKYLEKSLEYASNEDIEVYYVLYYQRIHSLFDEAFKTIVTKKTAIAKGFIKKLKETLAFCRQQNSLKESNELSERELDVLKLINNHLTNQQIADKLYISLNTVKSHVKNILLKLEVDKRSKAAGKARNSGLI